MLCTKQAHQNAYFRLATARMKITQIPYVIFKPPVIFLNIASSVSVMTYNSYDLYALDKLAHQSYIFQNFRSPSFSRHFSNQKSGFIQVLHHCSVSWKITPMYFCGSNLVYLGQKEPIEKKFSDFGVVWWNFTNFSSHIWNHTSVFL